MRAILHFASSVLMVSGALLIADAAATVLWQEPVSAFLAGREQADLEQALADPPVRKRVIEKRPLPGDAIGEIDFATLDQSSFVVEGTGSDDLRKGPGHYPDTALPGQPGTVAIAGHRTTYGAPFRDVDQLERGDRIDIEMPYGHFMYKVQKTAIVEPTQTDVVDDVGYKRLVLTACHPLYSAAQRIVVFARQVGHDGRSTVKRRR
jgi:sortase A